jgi:hypothetical protein
MLQYYKVAVPILPTVSLHYFANRKLFKYPIASIRNVSAVMLIPASVKVSNAGEPAADLGVPVFLHFGQKIAGCAEF